MMFFWPSASDPSELDEDVHVWVWNTLPGIDSDTRNAAILSPDERDRMSRFRFSQDRLRYLTSHANLRILLSRYTGCPPQELAFTVNEFGKPALHNSGDELRFNLSHSKDIGLLAVSRVGEIGADVEWIRPIEQEVADAHFSKRELEELSSLEGTQWLIGFFNCWTRKEAILKAEGCGLNLPLDGFDVSLLPGKPAMLREVRAEVQVCSGWRLQHLEPAPGVVGAIASTADLADVRCLRFTV